MPFPSLFSLGFASPAMLAWGVAIALPVLIHLWRRRHSREEPWGPMRLLEEAVGRSRRRLQIERGFLLLLRMILILLLVLAVAEPVADTSVAASMAPDARVHRVFVVDGSFSMAYRPTDRSRFERAKEIIRQIIQSSRPGDGASLVLAGSPTEVIVAEPVFAQNRFAQVVDQLRQPDVTLDPIGALREVQKVVTRGKAARYEFDRTEVYFLTDLCRVGWSLADKPQSEEYRKLAAELSHKAMLAVIDLGQEDTTNGSITSFGATPLATTVGRPVELTAEIRHFGAPTPLQSSAELFVDGRAVQRQTIKFDKSGQATADFSYTFTTAGLHEVELRLQADQLEVDNRRFLLVPVHDAIRVLLVEGRPSHERLATAGGFLAAALESSQPGSFDSSSVADENATRNGTVNATASIATKGRTYQVETIHENALGEINLAAYDTVLLADVAQLTTAEAKGLEHYVRNGGELLLFLGEQVMADRYNQTLRDLLPAELGERIQFDTPPKLDPLDYRHPIVRPFQSHPESGLLTLPIDQMIRLSTDAIGDQPETQIVLATEEGMPVIVERAIGQGRVILVATSADTSWTLAPIWPSFVPLVQKMASLAFESNADRLNLKVSQPISGTLRSDQTLDRLRVTTPIGLSLPTTTSKEKPDTWSFRRTETAGIYSLEESGKAIPGDRFAVNIDPAESDLAKLSKTTLQSDVWPGVPLVYRTTWTDSPIDIDLSTLRGNRTSRNLLMLALLLIVLETCWIIRATKTRV